MDSLYIFRFAIKQTGMLFFRFAYFSFRIVRFSFTSISPFPNTMNPLIRTSTPPCPTTPPILWISPIFSFRLSSPNHTPPHLCFPDPSPLL